MGQAYAFKSVELIELAHGPFRVRINFTNSTLCGWSEETKNADLEMTEAWTEHMRSKK